MSIIPPNDSNRGSDELYERPADEQQPVDVELRQDATAEEAAASEQGSIELKEVEGLSQGRIVMRRFVRHRGAMISLIVLVLVILLAFTSEGLTLFGLRLHGWWKWDYEQLTNISNGGEPTLSLVPTWLGGDGIHWGDHPLGQDSLGRDVFALVMRGAQQSLMIVFIVGIIATVIGAIVGAVSGFYRGWADTILMRLTDVIIIVPLIVVAATLGRKYGASGAFILAIALAFFSWTGLARLVRGDVLGLREREYVDAARVAGASNARIMFSHILPNTIGVIVVNTTLLMSATILTEAAISFLGFGVQQPDVSLGSIIFQYENAFQTRPWLFFSPASIIIIIALTINFIGDGLRDAFDPRQKRALNKAARKSASAARLKARQG